MRALYLSLTAAALACFGAAMLMTYGADGAPGGDSASKMQVEDRFVAVLDEAPEITEESALADTDGVEDDTERDEPAPPREGLDDLLGGLERPVPAPATKKPAPRKSRRARRRADQVRDVGVHKALGANLLGEGSLENVFGDEGGFDGKLNAALSGTGDELVVGSGVGGIGDRGRPARGEAGRFGEGTGAKFGDRNQRGGDAHDLPAADAAPRAQRLKVDKTSANEDAEADKDGDGRMARLDASKKKRAKDEVLSGKRRPKTGLTLSSTLAAGEPLGWAAEQARGSAGVDGRFELLRQATQRELPASLLAERTVKPASFLPRMAYFENTYLGRGADYREQLRALDATFDRRDRAYAGAVLPQQTLDAPTDAGLSLSATLSERGLTEPGRVYLQIGLKGSERFGWRRPPLDVVLVVDAAVRASAPRAVAEAVDRLLARLGPQDRLGVVDVGGAVRTTVPVSPLADARRALSAKVAALPGRARLDAGLRRAGALLAEAANGQARVPGTGTVILLTRGGTSAQVEQAAAAAHALTVQGAVTSVISLDDRAEWWRVAAAGHGNDHRGRRVADAIEAELDSLSKVIARLLRINIQLGPNARAVRVLGSRVLRQDEVVQVKAREEATDRNLSRTLGVKADRGDDDDGLQTVIPFFHGGDAHVVLVELWVEKPGFVADVTLKYKDMVELSNATARASVRLEALPRARAPAQVDVVRNLRGFLLAEAFADASRALGRGEVGEALQRLDRVAPANRADALVVAAFRRLIGAGDRRADVSRALSLAGRSRISHAPLIGRLR